MNKVYPDADCRARRPPCVDGMTVIVRRVWPFAEFPRR